MAKTKKKDKIKKVLEKFGAESIEKLMELADAEDTPPKLRADILKWFAEMEYGKPTSKQQDVQSESSEVSLEGDFERWSE